MDGSTTPATASGAEEAGTVERLDQVSLQANGQEGADGDAEPAEAAAGDDAELPEAADAADEAADGDFVHATPWRKIHPASLASSLHSCQSVPFWSAPLAQSWRRKEEVMTGLAPCVDARVQCRKGGACCSAECNVPRDPDGLVEWLLVAGLHKVKDVELPMQTSDFYSKCMLACKPPGKQTSALWLLHGLQLSVA